MKRSITVMTTSLALLILGLAFSVGTAVAQSAKDLVGTWTPVSAEVFGPNPTGNLTFDANGRFSLQLLRADLKKIAANKRDMGTPEENNAIVHGSITYYGTYTMNGTELVLHVEASSFPNWTGTDQKRTNVSLTADQLTYTNPAPSVGPGTPTILVWKQRQQCATKSRRSAAARPAAADLPRLSRHGRVVRKRRGLEPRTIESSAEIAGDAARLSGTKTLVCDAAVADFVLVSVSLAGTPALAIVRAADLPRERRTRETVIDETRRAYSVDLTGVSVPASALITGEKARVTLKAIRDAALLFASAEAAGGIAGRVVTRSAFGRKIGSYQSLKHTCSDILIGLERTRSHVYHAASLIAAGEDAEIALRMAKVEAGDSFVFAGDRAIQFHGGFGFTYDCDAQLYLRRALWLQYAFGDAAHHRQRLADLLLPSS